MVIFVGYGMDLRGRFFVWRCYFLGWVSFGRLWGCGSGYSLVSFRVFWFF